MIHLDKKGSFSLVSLLLVGLSALASVFSGYNLLTGLAILDPNTEPISIENGVNTGVWVDSASPLFVYLISDNLVNKIPYIGYSSSDVNSNIKLTTSSNTNFDDVLETTGILTFSQTNKLYHPDLIPQKNSYLILNSTNAWIFTNLKIVNTTNLPPMLSNLKLDKTKAGWGETFNFSLTVNDHENDNVDVTLYVNSSDGWKNMGVKQCHPDLGGVFPTEFTWLISDFNGSFIGQRKYFFTKTDGTTIYNTSRYSFEIEKDELSISISKGNNAIVNRAGDETTPLEISVYDLNKSAFPVGLKGMVLIQEGDLLDLTNIANCTVDSFGKCSINLNPGDDFTVGLKKWKVEFDDPSYQTIISPAYNVSVYGNFSLNLQKPNYHYSVKVGMGVPFQVALQDDIGNPLGITPDMKLKLSGLSWTSECVGSWAESNDVYSCTWDSTGNDEGWYSIKFDYNHDNFNARTFEYTNYFNLSNSATEGQIDIDPLSVEFDNITILQNQTVSTIATYTNAGENDADNVKLSLAGLEDGWVVNQGEYDCHTVTMGETCQRTFIVTIPKGATPKDYILKIYANWTNPSGKNDSVDTDFIVNISSNQAVIVNSSEISVVVPHGTTKYLGNFSLVSVGNDNAWSINYNISDGNLNNSWMSFLPFQILSLSKGQSSIVNITVSVPHLYPFGTYSGNFTVHPNGGLKDSSKLITIIVPSSKTWDLIPLEETFLVEPNTNGTLVRINLTNTGNTVFSVGLISYNGNASSLVDIKPMSPVSFSPDETLNYVLNYSITKETPPGMYFLNLTFGGTGNEPEKQSSLLWLNVSDLPPMIKSVNSTSRFIDQYFEGVENTDGNFVIGYTADVLDYIGISNVMVKITRQGKPEIWALLNDSLADPTSKNGIWTILFKSNSSGYVNLTFYVNDTSGNLVHSDPYGFYVYNTSNLNVNFNHSKPYRIVTNETVSCSIPNVYGCISRNFTIKNPSYAGAYYVNLTFDMPLGWIALPSYFSKSYLASNKSNSTVITFGIPKDYPEGFYNISTNLTWMNPSGENTTLNDKFSVDVSNIISNLTAEIKRPHYHAEIRTGNDVNYTFNITDLSGDPILNLEPTLTVWSTSEQPFVPCNLIEISSGIYSCVASSFGKTSGIYSVSIYANKKYYHPVNDTFNDYFTLTDNDISVTFYSEPSQELDIADKTSDKDYTFPVRVVFENTGDPIYNVNLTFLNVAPWGISDNGVYPCGQIDQGGHCEHIFNVTIPASAMLGKDLTINSSWINPDGKSGSREIELLVTITQKGVVKIKEPLSVSVNPWITNKLIGNYLLESIGTASALHLNSTIINLSDSSLKAWITFNPKEEVFNLPPGHNLTVNLSATIPKGQKPGLYSGDYNLRYDDGNKNLVSVSSPLRIQVLENRDWNTTLEINHTLEQGVQGEIDEPMIYNLGNVNITFSQALDPNNLFIQFIPSNLNVGVNNNESFSLVYDVPSDQPSGLYKFNLTIGDTKNPSTNKIVKVNIRIADLPPRISNIIIDKNHADLNKENVTVTASFEDSIMVQAGWINVSSDSGNTIIPMNLISGDTKKGVYSGTFIPTVEGENSIRIFSEDNSGNIGSSSNYTLDVVSATNLGTAFYPENITITGVKYTQSADRYVTLNISNIGLSGVYDANLSFNTPNGISVLTDGFQTYKFYSKIDENSTTAETLEIIANASVTPGIYNVNALLSYKNAKDLIQYANAQIKVNVSSNPVLEVTGLDNSYNIGYDVLNQLNATLTSNGNSPVEGISFVCKKTSDLTHDICSNFDFVFQNPETLTPGLSEEAHITVLTKPGIPPSTYAGQLIITADPGISEETDLNFHVGNSYNWYLTPGKVNLTVGSENYGSAGTLTIYNTGNVPMNYEILQENSSFIILNTTDRQIQKQEELEIPLYYNSTGVLPGVYSGKIYVNCTEDGQHPEEINITFEVINFSVAVDPVDFINNAEAGDRFSIVATARNATDYLEALNQIEWRAYIENNLESKRGTSIGYDLADLPEWRIGWALPNVTSGRTYDLRVVGIYKKYNAISNYIFHNKIYYMDVEAPKVLDTYAPDTVVNNNVVIYANVTDNVEVKNVGIEVYYPNGSLATLDNMSFVSGNEYAFNFENSSVIGDYDYKIIPKDVNGITSVTPSYFEVYRNVVVNFDVSDLQDEIIPSDIGIYEETPLLQENPDVKLNLSNQTKAITLHERKYYVKVKILNYSILFSDVPVKQGENISLIADAIPSRDPFLGEGVDVKDAIYIEPLNLNYSDALLVFNYTKFPDVNGEELKVASCSEWDTFMNKCNVDWVINDQTTPYTKKHTLWVVVPHFSAWVLYIPANVTSPPATKSGSNGGGSGGGSSSPISMPSVSVSTAKIKKEMNAGDDAIDSFTIANSGTEPIPLSFMVNDLSDFVSLERDSIKLKNGTSKSITVHFHVPALTQPGTYHGTIKILGSGLEIPVTLIVKQEYEKLIDFTLELPNENVEENGTLSYKINLANVGEGSDEIPVNIYSAVLDIEGNVLRGNQEAIVLNDKLSLTRTFDLKNLSTGNYLLMGAITYSDKNATASSAFKVIPHKAKNPSKEEPRSWIPQNVKDFVFKFRFILFFILIGSLLMFMVAKKLKEVTVKHYEYPVPNLKKVPSTGVDTIAIGKITELNKPALIRLKDLSTHAICDGATGGGKTVSAQVIVEEALKHGVNVIVLDPTGQWSGFLRGCNDPEMLAHYSEFGMKSSESRGFNGNIRAIEGSSDSIDITPFLNRKKEGTEGEIQIFSMHKLKNKDIELFVNSMIKQVFDANLEESNRLETLIVFDEVHRVLESFGGSMHGQDQIERGVREFRKWGVGLLLISQVISDFKPQIRANIGTKIQFRSRDKNDLKMIKETFGIEYVRHIVKSAVGRGLLHNPAYNKGMPYFVDVRPLLHYPHKLTNEELEKYEHYNKIVDDLKRKIKLFKARGRDVFDMLSILKLLEKNIKKGKFDMVKIYLDEIKEKMNR